MNEERPNPDPGQLYARLERLERAQERHEVILQELSRRISEVEEMIELLHEIRQSNARLEAKISLIQALLMLLLGGVVAAGYTLFQQ